MAKKRARNCQEGSLSDDDENDPTYVWSSESERFSSDSDIDEHSRKKRRAKSSPNNRKQSAKALTGLISPTTTALSGDIDKSSSNSDDEPPSAKARRPIQSKPKQMPKKNERKKKQKKKSEEPYASWLYNISRADDAVECLRAIIPVKYFAESKSRRTAADREQDTAAVCNAAVHLISSLQDRLGRPRAREEKLQHDIRALWGSIKILKFFNAKLQSRLPIDGFVQVDQGENLVAMVRVGKTG